MNKSCTTIMDCYSGEDSSSESPSDCNHTWREEAEAVIRDIGDHVRHASLSGVLASSDSLIYLNLTTLEGQQLTVRLTHQGFAVVSHQSHDTDDVIGKKDSDDVTDIKEDDDDDSLQHYETAYALLSSVSKGYSHSFGDSLKDKLSALKQAT